MLQTFTFDGTGRQIDAAARYFRYESASASGADESIRVTADGNDLGTYLPGDDVTLPVRATRWTITPLSTANVGTVRLGEAIVGGRRILGSVRVIDQGAEKTLTGSQFLQSSTASAIAGTVSWVGLRAMTRPLSVKRISLQSDVAGRCYVGRGQSGTAISSNLKCENKNFALGNNSDAEIITAGTPAATPTALEIPNWRAAARVYVPANTPTEVPISTPIVVPVGWAVYVSGDVVLRLMSAVFDFEQL